MDGKKVNVYVIRKDPSNVFSSFHEAILGNSVSQLRLKYFEFQDSAFKMHMFILFMPLKDISFRFTFQKN